MPVFGVSFVVLVAAALAFAMSGDLSKLGFAHAVFAGAALPLMLAAITHFVPVLTRSRSPAAAVWTLPGLAGLGGLGASAVFAFGWSRAVLMLPAALVGLVALLAAVWIGRRIAGAFGPAHPGARWYVAALGFLLLAMAAVFGLLLDADRYQAWRNLHLHANLLGWIGLTALGTLPVLLPTVLQKMQPTVAARLRIELPVAVGGALAIALGAAFGWPWLALCGAAVLAYVPARHLQTWSTFFGAERLVRGVAASLAAATTFLLLLLLAGAAHGFGALPGERMLSAYVFGFLLPLILGALAALMPVWRFAGPDSAQREAFRAALERHARLRAFLCVLAGVLQLFAVAWAAMFAAAAVALFAAALAAAWRPRQERLPGRL
jgi:hypothetical protein